MRFIEAGLLLSLTGMLLPLAAVRSQNVAQNSKKPLENSGKYLNEWKRLRTEFTELFGDGKFAFYSYADKEDDPSTIVVVSTKSKKADTLYGSLGNTYCAKDNQTLIYKKSGDTVVKYNVVKKTFTYIPQISELKYVKSKTDDFLILRTNNGELKIENLISKKQFTLDGVSMLQVNENDASTVFAGRKGGLTMITLADLKFKQICEFGADSYVRTDRSGYNALIEINSDGKSSLYAYPNSTGVVHKILDDTDENIPEGYGLNENTAIFSPDGKSIAFALQEKKTLLPGQKDGSIPPMEIWHHKELTHQGMYKRYAIGVVNLRDAKPSFKLIDQGDVELKNVLQDRNEDGNAGNKSLAIIKQRFEMDGRIYYNPNKAANFYMYSIEDGTKLSLTTRSRFIRGQDLSVSPSGRFLYWFDLEKDDMYCYDIGSKKSVNVTEAISVPNDLIPTADGAVPRRLYLAATWLQDADEFLISDKYDVWQVDASGNKKPLNITGGYGRRNNIKFWPVVEELEKYNAKNGDRIAIAAFDEDKRNALGTVILGKANSLQMNKLEDRLTYWILPYSRIFKKSTTSGDYLLTSQRADEAPNLYHTKDFQTYTKLSEIHPEKEYNWMTSELIKYPLHGGKPGMAILYKPENFDPTKKYPILFQIYQERTSELNWFLNPAPFANLPIPFYASNGYILVVPDIVNDEPGKLTTTVVNTITSTVDYLKQFPWFDYTKMGVQGQSFGGFETNILVANTKLFAAAQCSDGLSNVTVFGQSHGELSDILHERGQHNFNTTLWEHPDVYIQNSPVFQADKATTPLLIEHGRADNACAFNQGESMFFALKRLQKPVWMVVYEGADHGHFGGGNGLVDFNIRRQQFFDHYLKGTPMPLWMKEQTLSLELVK